ncbi:phosphoribosylanthranilate isomerase [Brachybacterium hainanense]|uniref:N-(5'-phosphoribosyl)anthranilate isomerase n=1 Tax=Brachybacterium hainanense TaxID=1541174 RepID=A0ABV6RAQ3_9MICO
MDVSRADLLVKICGLRDAGTALHAARQGADAVGVVMAPRSPRHVTHEQASAIASAVHEHAPGVDVVLVVAAMPAAEAAQEARRIGADVLQLHGRYTAADADAARAVLPRIWRAASLARDPDLRPGEFGEERLLVDGADPGSGRTWELDPADAGRLGTGWILAGGLTPENVASARRQPGLGGVDVSSGVESAPGVKDPERIARFLAAARG